MNRKILASTTLAFGLLASALPASAQEDQTFNAKQTDAIRKIVREYLIEHPETITEAVEALREKMRAQAEAEALKGIDSRKEELFRSKDDPIAGSPVTANVSDDNAVVVVEFFDYNCPYCKVSLDPVMDAAKPDRKVRAVFKEMPILSEDSMTAARVALAAKAQGKYEEVHRAFMKYRGKLDEKTIYRLAGEAGTNLELLRKDVLSVEIDKQIRKNAELAHSLGISSTPTFVIAKADGSAARIVSSALEAQTLNQLIDITRKGGRLTQQ